MKNRILPKFFIVIFLFITGNISVWGQEEIHFDISKSSVLFSDSNYSGKNSNGETVSGEHNPANKYIITGTTTNYFIRVGDPGETEFVTKNFIIYLNGVDIRRSGKQGCAFGVYNKNESVVAVILKDGSKNILYSGYNRAGLEKSGGASANGTLLITCEKGYDKWLVDNNQGHTTGTYNESACDNSCGYLDARSGNAWYKPGVSTYYHAGAGIGTCGEGTGGSNKPGENAGNNALVNLTIAGGNITAAGTWGNTGGSSGGGASIGTGCALDQDLIAGTVSGLKITGGNINAYRMDNSAACIGGGYRSGYVTMDIYGGTIKANNIELNSSNVTKMRAPAIGGGGGGNTSESPAGATVHIHNGKIEASGHYGSAIGSGAGGSAGHGQNAIIIIDNGDITAKTTKGDGNGCGAAIGAGGSLSSGYAGNADITINGGKIIANSELGADIGGGGTNSTRTGDYGGEGLVTITGGDITTNTGGIGGGRANKGKGGNAEIIISGAETKITAQSIGGGRSKTNIGGNVKLSVNGGVLNVTDYIGGGIGGANSDMIGWAKVYINGGTISGRTVMKASATDGCVFEMSGGTLTSKITGQPGGAVYMIDPNGVATLNGGTIQNCQGTTGGAVYMTGGTFTISGTGKMINNKATQNGAALYLAGTGEVYVKGGSITGITDENFEAIYMSGGKFNMSGGNIANFKGAKSGAVLMEDGTFTMTNGLIDNCSGTEGGAIYMSGGKFDISGGTISNCKGTQKGGAVYLAKGTFDISGNGAIKGNSSADGGAVYLAGEGTLNINGGTINGNEVTNAGGAIFLTSGTFNMNAGKVDGNKSSGGNGGGIYIKNGTVKLLGGEVTGNIATTGKGGGFYVAGGDVTLSNGSIAANKAKLAGGGICMEGNDANNKVTVAVNGCTLTENEATDGNGGGIFLSNAAMTYNGGILTFNKALGTGEFTTAYLADANSIKGVGGGIYISSNSKLDFGDLSKLGVYANSADMAADDLFANGNNTSLLLPNIANMSLQNYAGNAQGLGWYEDYFKLDTQYNISNIAKGNTALNSFDNRFRDARLLGIEYMRLYDFTEESKELKNCYISLALGFLFSDLTIRVAGLKPNEVCIFNVQGTAENGKYRYRVPVYGTSSQYDEQKIVKLPVDKYTVSLIQGWPWAYNGPSEGSITKMNSEDGGIYMFNVEHKETSITHDENKTSIKMK